MTAMPYAIIRDRKQQYTVRPGQRVRVASMAGEAGSKVVFDSVLLVGGDGAPKMGSPVLEGARVEGTVVRQGRGRKVVVFKKKRRKGYRRKQGHRQGFTEVLIDAVHAG
jgi:large subunit ribosomal protein L21